MNPNDVLILGKPKVSSNSVIRRKAKGPELEARSTNEEGRLKEQLSVVVHELRTPLALIVGYSGLLQRNLNIVKTATPASNVVSQEKAFVAANHSLEAILEYAGQMNQLITQLFDFSDIHNRQFEGRRRHPVELAELMERLVCQQIMLYPNNLIQLQPGNKKVQVMGDARQIEQVLNNLIGNAVKYSPARSQVIVGYEVSQQDNCEVVIVWVQDQGCGIRQEEQNHIFEQFYRVDEQERTHTSGLGLGLHICQEIVEQHGGKIWLKSQPGVGSTFCFSLPVNSPQPQTQSKH